MRRLSNIRVRNVATIGGNLAHGDPHMDLPPILIALNAKVAVVGANGAQAAERTIAVEDLFAGYFETVLAKNELIAELHIPPQGKSRAAYIKVTTGSVEDWPALGVAVALEAEGSAVKSARVVVSAATEKATRLKGAERLLAGQPWTRRCSRARATPPPRKPNALLMCAALPPTSASWFASMSAARCGKHFTSKRSPATERLDP
jgi:carbon-monoxide dehydrogenase medium subunit